MLEDIIALLQKSEADEWEIEETKTTGWEYYFIRHDLDQNRAKKVSHIKLTVYKKIEDGKYLGQASCEIEPTETTEQAEKKIKDLVERASYVKNPYYELNEKKDAEPLCGSSYNVATMAKDFMDVMNNLPETKTEDVNSYEIFANEEEKHFVTSRGIDLVEKYPSSMIEVVTNARNEEHEIELYRLYHSGTCDSEGLKKDVSKVLQYGKDRLNTVPTPQLGKYPVVFSTDDARNIYRYFLERLHVQYVYRQISDWKIDTPIFEGVKGDSVSLRTLRELPNSNKNFAYDEEGAPIVEKVILDANTPKSYWGGRQFASYLGVKDSFNITNVEAFGGSQSEEEIRTGNYLEVVEFSDFQVDPVTGNVFGEIRLGYLHEGEKVTAVSGGSVSGSMHEYAKNMYMSKEAVQYNNVRIPSVTKLMDVTITGADA